MPAALPLAAGVSSRGRLAALLFAARKERFAEGVVEIVAAGKIRTAVFLRFGEQTNVDHVKNDIAEILAGPNTPFFENRHGHRSELGQSKIANAAEQFLSGNVADAGPPFADVLLSMIQRLADEGIGILFEPRVFGPDQFECSLKTYFLHVKILPA